MIEHISSEESMSLPSSLDIRVDQFKDDFSCEDVIDMSLQNFTYDHYDNNSTINFIRERCETIEEKESEYDQSIVKKSISFYKMSEDPSLANEQLLTLRKNSLGMSNGEFNKLKVTKRKNTFKEELDDQQKKEQSKMKNFKKKNSIFKAKDAQKSKKQKFSVLLLDNSKISQKQQIKSNKQTNLFTQFLKQSKQIQNQQSSKKKKLKSNFGNKLLSNQKICVKKPKFIHEILKLKLKNTKNKKQLFGVKVIQNSLKNQNNKKISKIQFSQNKATDKNPKIKTKSTLKGINIYSSKHSAQKQISKTKTPQKIRSSLNKTFDNKLYDFKSLQRYSANSYGFKKFNHFKSFI